MRAGLGVIRVGADSLQNLAAMVRMAREAARGGADLVLFPEAALSGLINDDDPAHDLALGEPIPGPATETLVAVARELGIWIAFGLLERAGDRLYDTAVLLDAKGTLRLSYRRINPQWHGSSASPEVYRVGTGVDAVMTPWGKMAILICGDLFDDRAVAQARALAPDWVLFPFAREFTGGGVAQGRWDREEMPFYAERVRILAAPMLMVNYLADGATLPTDASFGGAFVVLRNGTVAAQKPLGEEGLLMVDVP